MEVCGPALLRWSWAHAFCMVLATCYALCLVRAAPVHLLNHDAFEAQIPGYHARFINAHDSQDRRCFSSLNNPAQVLSTVHGLTPHQCAQACEKLEACRGAAVCHLPL